MHNAGITAGDDRIGDSPLASGFAALMIAGARPGTGSESGHIHAEDADVLRSSTKAKPPLSFAMSRPPADEVKQRFDELEALRCVHVMPPCGAPGMTAPDQVTETDLQTDEGSVGAEPETAGDGDLSGSGTEVSEVGNRNRQTKLVGTTNGVCSSACGDNKHGEACSGV